MCDERALLARILGSAWHSVRVRWFGLITLAACSAQPTPKPVSRSAGSAPRYEVLVDAPTLDTRIADAPLHTAASRSSCPASFAAVTGQCAAAGRPVPPDAYCEYAEGTCACAAPPWCSGATPGPMPVAWQCRPTLRADGCPSFPPDGRHAMTCQAQNKRCSYVDDCCRGEFTCRDGQWRGEYRCINAFP